MDRTKLLDSAQYITDRSGERTGVILDLDVWQELIALVGDHGKSDTPTELDATPDQRRSATMDREEQAFNKLHSSLYPQYAGQYVAIYNEQFVDSDADQVALYRRMRQQYPDEFVWIAPVTERPGEVLHFRSPRFRTGHP
ncbi:MAG: hypothetical protein KDE19_23515 [Caldilineaceae bacterium]|nr:hypothetical protein [Caldilineaceae bacterium]